MTSTSKQIDAEVASAITDVTADTMVTHVAVDTITIANLFRNIPGRVGMCICCWLGVVAPLFRKFGYSHRKHFDSYL